jgi:hypothetical protein
LWTWVLEASIWKWLTCAHFLTRKCLFMENGDDSGLSHWAHLCRIVTCAVCVSNLETTRTHWMEFQHVDIACYYGFNWKQKPVSKTAAFISSFSWRKRLNWAKAGPFFPGKKRRVVLAEILFPLTVWSS